MICIFFVVISAFACYFVAFCQRFIYEYMDIWSVSMEHVSPRCRRLRSSISSLHCLSLGCIRVSSELTSRNSLLTLSIAGYKQTQTRCVAMPSLMAIRWVCVLPPSECYWLVNGGWVRTPVLFFAICGPKYTQLSLPVRECPQFAMPFSYWWYLVAFQRYSRSSREVVRNRVEILMFFGPPNFGGRGHHISDWFL